jgi:hypothetical protein
MNAKDDELYYHYIQWENEVRPVVDATLKWFNDVFEDFIEGLESLGKWAREVVEIWENALGEMGLKMRARAVSNLPSVHSPSSSVNYSLANGQSIPPRSE